MYVQSTDYDRTIASALSNLAGLFPPTIDDTWHSDILWNPIPVHSIPLDLDYIIHAGRQCPKYDAAFNQFVMESTEVQEIYAKYGETFTYLSEKCGKNLTTFNDILGLYKTFYMENLRNLT